MIVFIFLLLFYVLQCLILPKMFLLPAHRLDLRWKRLDHCEIDIYQVKKKLRGLFEAFAQSTSLAKWYF